MAITITINGKSLKEISEKELDKKHEQQKAVIELSNSYEEANEYIEQTLGLITLHKKIEYLKRNFNISFIGHDIKTFDDYKIALTAIVDKKWH